MEGDNKTELLVLADAMNNLAEALRENKQVLHAMQQRAAAQPAEMQKLQEAVYELAQRVAVLSAKLR